MCSILPEDKQGPVLDDIRKISKERRRHRVSGGDRTPSTTGGAQLARWPADGLNGVYRSTSELSATAGDDRVDCGSPPVAIVGCDGLMATVRATRRKQSITATVVYNPAFYDAPVAYAAPHRTQAANPARQPYLRMTPDNGFSLQQRLPPSTVSADAATHDGHQSATRF